MYEERALTGSQELRREFHGQVALVTGGASGIGRATAHLFAERGASAVALVDRAADPLDAVAEEVRALGAQPVPVLADLSDPAQCANVVHRVVAVTERVDVVVNNAAIARDSTPFVDYRLADFTEDLSVNLTAGFVVAQQAARHLLEASRPGSIVFVASINAMGAGVGSAGYCASKAAVLGLMNVMAAELGEAGIRVNAVSPGPADTPRSVQRVGEEQMRLLRQRFDGAALRRLATPAEVAEAILFLSSERARYVTGHNLVVDGGLTASVYSTARTTTTERDDAHAAH